MGYTHECRFKKKFKLEKNWVMSIDDVVEATGLDKEELQSIFLTHLAKTKSRTKSMNEVFAHCLKVLFPKEKPDDVVNVSA
jgi:hypothetical protein